MPLTAHKESMQDLTYTPKSAWKRFAAEADQKEIFKFVERYREFLSACKTERETIAYVERRLRARKP